MKRVGIVCLCALLFAAGVCAQPENGLQPLACGVSAECSALAALNIFVNGIGSCSGTASANCAAFALATEPCIDEVVLKVEREECTPEDITIAAECYAKAIAAVYVSAYVAIECEGAGAGCGYSHANGEAWACTFAAALVDLQVSVGANQAQCEVTTGAMAAIFAAVASEVQAEVCVEGDDFEQDFEEEFAVRITEIIAEALASCWVDCTEGGAVAVGMGEAATFVTPSEIDGGADVSVGGAFALPCNVFEDPTCLEMLTGNSPSPGSPGVPDGPGDLTASPSLP